MLIYRLNRNISLLVKIQIVVGFNNILCQLATKHIQYVITFVDIVTDVLTNSTVQHHFTTLTLNTEPCSIVGAILRLNPRIISQ